MTIEKCLSICRGHGFAFSGLEYRSECHCFAKEPSDGFTFAWHDKCNMKCLGDKNQICGGENAMSIWSTPIIIQSRGLCVYDFPGNRRVFQGLALVNDPTMTRSKCAFDICMAQGYDWFGVENGNECHCGNDLARTIPTDPSECKKPCAGDSSEYCGNSWRLLIDSWWINSVDGKTLGSSEEYGHGDCIKDFPENRLIHHKYSVDFMTVEKCQDICTSGYFKVYGVEDGSDCYCGHSVHPYIRLSDLECNIPCPGNASEYCGGASAMNIYKVETKCEAEKRKNPIGIGVYTPACIESGVNIGAFKWKQFYPSTGYSWCVNPNGDKLPWTMTPPGHGDIDCKPYYTGQCLRDNVITGDLIQQILQGPEYEDGQMTIELCYDSCKAAFFKFAGVENGNQCHCGNQIHVLPLHDSLFPYPTELESKIYPDIDCGDICPGDSSETCGGEDKMKIYNVRSQCEIARDDALLWWINNPNGTIQDGVSIPKCTEVGEYEPEQCSVYGLCYCVDVNGNQLPFTVEACSPFYTGQCIENYRTTKILNFQNSSEDMTPDFCENKCKTLDPENLFYGVQNSTDCYCGKDFNDHMVPSNYYLPPRFCDSPCSGNATQVCGGSDNMNLYSILSTDN